MEENINEVLPHDLPDSPSNADVFDFPLRVDELALQERSAAEKLAPLIDERVRLLLRDNRLGLWCGQARRYSALEEEDHFLDIPLRCTAHAHFECEFRWVRLVADFRTAQGVFVTDIIPKDSIHEYPVKIVVKSSLGGSFQTEQFKIGPSAIQEKSREYQTYFPTLTTSGIGSSSAVWQFQALPEEVLHVDSELRVRVTMPPDLPTISPRFTLRGRLSVKGMLGYLPVVGNRTLTIEASSPPIIP